MTTDVASMNAETDIEHNPKQLAILAAATTVFARHGYRAGTIAKIASEAGLSQPGLIHHFQSKDAILMAVIDLREREDLDLLLPAFERAEPVLHAYERVLTKNAAKPELMRLFAMLSAEALDPDHPAHDYFVDRYDRLLEATTRGVACNQRDGLIRDDLDAAHVAGLIIAAADGLRYQSLIAGGPIEHWRRFADLAHMLAPPVAATDGGTPE